MSACAEKVEREFGFIFERYFHYRIVHQECSCFLQHLKVFSQFFFVWNTLSPLFWKMNYLGIEIWVISFSSLKMLIHCPLACIITDKKPSIFFFFSLHVICHFFLAAFNIFFLLSMCICVIDIYLYSCFQKFLNRGLICIVIWEKGLTLSFRVFPLLFSSLWFIISLSTMLPAPGLHHRGYLTVVGFLFLMIIYEVHNQILPMGINSLCLWFFGILSAHISLH